MTKVPFIIVSVRTWGTNLWYTSIMPKIREEAIHIIEQVYADKAAFTQCVLVDGLRPDNNQAERSIRPMVIMRKISGGSRSSAGTTTRMGLARLVGVEENTGMGLDAGCGAALGGQVVKVGAFVVGQGNMLDFLHRVLQANARIGWVNR
jgi:hypothetical protein